MKKITIILALFMLFKPVLPVLEYAVFYDYIKKELCENKDKTKLKCNGKCHLAKEMAAASDTSGKGNDKKHVPAETGIVFFQAIEGEFTFRPPFYVRKSKTASSHALSYSHLAAASIFRPPVV